eukprot:TRINITY_DN5803_c0_g1_i10.p1 TRINITY_DN5803_c0_g1~~TRINITY_DN5803_c0_g1_i10.p1  ORF type:complete len:377 (+),score=33.26 TRINITY_DN5803_c0_g1_i10:99-1229(+)
MKEVLEQGGDLVGQLPGLRSRRSLETPRNKQNNLEPSENIEDIYANAEFDRINQLNDGKQKNLLRDLLDISGVLTDAAEAVIDDSFWRCFKENEPDPWNWNLYLFPLWCLGVLFRNFILFPLRFILLMAGIVLFFFCFFMVQLLWKEGKQKTKMERAMVRILCGVFVASWTGVIKYHGPIPSPKANCVWVANHTSMIDYVVLSARCPFAAIMQLHSGWIAFMQTKVLASLGCIWFKRTEMKDRSVVFDRMKAHVSNPNSTPLLVFPEGTCVNNEYCVMFKRGAFDLGVTVCPIAIKYNKIFVDAFWNSRRVTFGQHLIKLMRSWAVVCDVWFLEPQHKKRGRKRTRLCRTSLEANCFQSRSSDCPLGWLLEVLQSG